MEIELMGRYPNGVKMSKIDLLVWKSGNPSDKLGFKFSFKIDLIVWKSRPFD